MTRTSEKMPRAGKTRSSLAEKLNAPGGISEEQALDLASHNVSKLRQEYIKFIPREIGKLEQIMRSGEPGQVTSAQLESLLGCAGPILTLTGTFHCTLLDTVVRQLCDLCRTMLDRSLHDPAPLMVHIQAMSILYSATINGVNQDGAILILKELDKIHAHFNAQPDDGQAAGGEAAGNAAVS
ncbi:MAG: hypothetical protein ACXWLT_01085 [Rhizomicrobium sp.]